MAGRTLLDACAIVDALDIQPGAHVADLHAGSTGHFVWPLADAVGDDGRVYAVDIRRDALSMLESDRKMRLVHHVIPVWGNPECANGVDVPEASLDFVFLVSRLWATSDRSALAGEVQRLLKPEGKLVVLEWLPETRHPLAPPVNVRVSSDAATRDWQSRGFVPAGTFRPSPWHWGHIFTA